MKRIPTNPSRIRSVGNRKVPLALGYQPIEPGIPFTGPAIAEVTQPP